MAFLESRMSVHIERGAEVIRTNRGRTKAYTGSGKMSQDFAWSAPISEFDISHGILLPAGYEEIDAMWHVINFTPYSGLRFRNWADFKGVKGNTSLVNITGTQWQLRRTYTFASITFHRPIYKPTSDVVVYNSSDTPVTFTLDTATGIATVTSGTPSYWVGTFDYPVTFKENDMSTRLDGVTSNLILVADQIVLEEIRL